MDTSDPDIRFDRQGVCNHCRRYEFASGRASSRPEVAARALDEVVTAAARAGRGRDHDCVIGLSGGVDSSNLAYMTVRKLGLWPLAIHLDNGWNSKLAVRPPSPSTTCRSRSTVIQVPGSS